MVWILDGENFFDDVFIRFNRIHERDRQTDTAWRHRPRLCIASCGKNEIMSCSDLTLNFIKVSKYMTAGEGFHRQTSRPTRNSSVDEISDRNRLNHAIVVWLYHPYIQFARNVRLISSANCDFFGASLLFLILRLTNTLAYLFTKEFLVDNIYDRVFTARRTIMTLISPGDCTLQCGMWLWNHDSEFTKWQHSAVWYVALGWHAMKFAQTSAILEFYIWFRFWPYQRSRHVIMHQSPKFYLNRTTLSRKKWRHVDFQDGGSQPSWILGVQ